MYQGVEFRGDKMIQFPQGFLWGAATSAYQVEGNNVNSDWWEWERRAGLKELSGAACRHYELYKQDFDLASSLGHNCHRLSVEWGRIEPREGEFSSSELNHYKEVIAALRERGLKPVVTLHHFTNPAWFSRMGGWTHKHASGYYLRYVEKVVRELSEGVGYWVTINEPLVYIYHAYILGVWPPQEKSVFKAWRVQENLIRSHIRAYRLIQRIYKEKNLKSPLISIAKNTQAFMPCVSSLRNKIATYLRDRYFNLDFVERLIRAGTLDFIGINYYSRSLVETNSWGIGSMAVDTCSKNHSQLQKNSIGWDVYPEGLYKLLLEFKRYNLAIIILENGICTPDDNLRWEFIHRHLGSIHLAIKEGAKVAGYIYWSLLDNFEWDKGFGPRFGLIEVDYNNYGRRVRESARKFASVCKTGVLE